MDGKINRILYLVTASFIDMDDVVVDYGCQDGWGTKILAGVAKKAVGIDKDKELIKVAMTTYKTDNNYYMSDNLDQAPELPRSDVSVAINIFKTLRFPDSFLGKLKMSTRKLVILSEINTFEDEEWKLFAELKLTDTFLSVYERI